MNKSVKKTRRELAMPFSCVALAERNRVTEIIETDSIRLIPTIPYKLAHLKITSSRSSSKVHEFKPRQRISVDLSNLTDGLYYYELSLFLDTTTEPASLKGKFVMSAGISREYNSKWGLIV